MNIFYFVKILNWFDKIRLLICRILAVRTGLKRFRIGSAGKQSMSVMVQPVNISNPALNHPLNPIRNGHRPGYEQCGPVPGLYGPIPDHPSPFNISSYGPWHWHGERSNIEVLHHAGQPYGPLGAFLFRSRSSLYTARPTSGWPTHDLDKFAWAGWVKLNHRDLGYSPLFL